MPLLTDREHLAPPTERPPLTHAQIFKLYAPLALSWVFMSVEGPSTTAIIGRLPQKELNSAALLVLMSIALWVESPVIDLLSTATTLAKNRQHYAQLSKYTWGMIFWVTFAHATIVVTPLYGFVTLRLLSLPPQVAAQARLGLVLLIPWAGFIGWRRYLQGILIRFHRTRIITIGTFMRVFTMSAVGWSLYGLSHLQGIVIAGAALISGVAAESIFIHFLSRPTIKREFGRKQPKDREISEIGYAPSEIAESAIADPDGCRPDPTLDADGQMPLTIHKLVSFHMPLIATTMVALIGNPIISGALSKSSEPILALASWQVVATLIWLCRTIEFALPEVIITLYKDRQSAAKLRQFAIRVGLTISGTMTLLVLTGGDRFFFGKVLGESAPVVGMAHVAFICGISLPLIGCQQNYIKGMLTAHHLTTARFMSALVSFTTLVVMLGLGVFLHWTGVINAAVALNVSLLGETTVLFWFWRTGVKAPFGC